MCIVYYYHHHYHYHYIIIIEGLYVIILFIYYLNHNPSINIDLRRRLAEDGEHLPQGPRGVAIIIIRRNIIIIIIITTIINKNNMEYYITEYAIICYDISLYTAIYYNT